MKTQIKSFKRIKQLELEIEQNKQLATAFIADVLSSNGTSSYSVYDESEHDNEFEETNEEEFEEHQEYDEEESA
jgi:hypothetical protein